MAWNIANNCHVNIWINDVLPPGPPVGATAYDGPAQLLVPYMVSGLPSPYRHRLVLAPGSIPPITNADINSVTTQCWVAIIDDANLNSVQYYKIVDVSVSTAPSTTPGEYEVMAVFLSMILSPVA